MGVHLDIFGLERKRHDFTCSPPTRSSFTTYRAAQVLPYNMQTPVSCMKRKRLTLKSQMVSTVRISRPININSNVVSMLLYLFSLSAASFSRFLSASSFGVPLVLQTRKQSKARSEILHSRAAILDARRQVPPQSLPVCSAHSANDHLRSRTSARRERTKPLLEESDSQTTPDWIGAFKEIETPCRPARLSAPSPRSSAILNCFHAQCQLQYNRSLAVMTDKDKVVKNDDKLLDFSMEMVRK